MDERNRSVLAAAHALRAWVHAQQVARHSAVLPLTALHAPALTATMVAAHALAGSADAALLDTDDAPAFDAGPTPPSISFLTRLMPLARGLAACGRGAMPVVVRVWRPALASVLVLALVGMARSSWPQWSRAIKAQLAAAGEHVSVFDRPAPPAPEVVPAKTKGDGRAVPFRRVGRLHVESNPAGAHVIVDGKDRGFTPLTLTDLAAGTHPVILKGDAGSVQQSVVISPEKTTQLNEAIYSGWLHVSSSLELQLSEAGRGLRLDDSNQVLLTPGVHELRFENRRAAFTETRTVEVRPGETASISVEPPASKLSITASTPAEVLVDGTLVGGTPLTDFPLPVGTREIVVRNAAGVERRSTINVTVEAVRLDVDFK